MTKARGKTAKTPSKTEFHRVSEVARILDVNRNTVYRGIETGSIPAVKVGRVYRIPVSWLEGERKRT